MNRDRYRLVLSRRLGFRVPVAEHVSSTQGTGRRPRRGAALLLSGLAAAAMPALARDLPTPAATFIRPGQANNVAAPVMENARTMVIRQLDARPAVMQWQNFDIGRDYTVRFDQPTRQSRALNIVLPGAPRSEIYGNLKANGQVFLFNQAGILFGAGSVVDVGGLVASTLKLNDKLIEQSLSSLSGYSKNDARFLFSEAALAKDGTAGDIDVAAGARIVAAENGRVLIAAPNVTNAGQISTPQGQTILAAGEKLYLADSIDSRLRGVLVEVNGGGTVTNAAAGDLLAERGNITLAGLNVNQLGSARATTTVTMNGSIYLQAKDSAVAVVGTNLTGAYATGAVALGAGSTTTVMPETDGKDVLRDDTPFNRSEISAIGKTIDVGNGARVVAPAGRIDFTAQGDAANSGDFASNAAAAINVAANAVIDVSGLRGVEVAADRNHVEVELRGDELKDSPLQRDTDFGRPLYGKKIWVDVMAGFADSDTPLADITGYRAGISRSVAELSSVGGDISLQSAGSVNVAEGARLDVSGGSIVYKASIAGDSTDHRLPVTYLETATGAWVKAADASADMRFSGRTRTMLQAVADRVVGHDAGRVILTADTLRLDGELRATTVAGSGQRTAPEERARWFDWSGNAAASDLGDRLAAQLLERERDRVKLEEFVGNELKKPYLTQVGRRAWRESSRPMGGQLEIRAKLDDAVSPAVGNIALVAEPPASRAPDTAYLRSSLLTSAGFDNLLLQASGTFSIAREVSATGLPGARLRVESSAFDVAGKLWLPGGEIDLHATDTGEGGVSGLVDHGAVLSTAGAWTNDMAEQVGLTDPRPVVVDGGRVVLASDGDLTVRGGVDVSGGAWREVGGKTHAGDGGAIELTTGDFGDGSTIRRRLDIAEADFSAYATATQNGLRSGRGGSLTLKTSAVDVVSGNRLDTSASGLLTLGSEFFRLGGFAGFEVRGYGGVSVADGVHVAPDPLARLVSDRPLAQGYGAALSGFTTLADIDPAVRGATSLTFDARALGDSSFGALKIGRDAVLEVDPGGSITLLGQQQVLVDGSLRAAGGSITIGNQGASDTGPNDSLATSGQVHLGANAVLDVSGAVVRDPASTLATGRVLDGGRISLEADYGYLVLQQGAQLRADGAAAVLDIVPTAGPVRRAQTVTSAGGSVALTAREGMMVDGSLSARSGGGESAGGSLAVRLTSKSDVVQWDRSDDIAAPADLNPARRLELASGGSSGAAAIAAGQKIDSATHLGKGRFDVDKVAQGGFQNASFASSDYLVFASDLTLSLPGRLTLEAPTLLGDNAARVALSAASLLLTQSTLPGERSVPYAPKAGHTGGRLTLSAADMEVRGRVSMTGFAATELSSAGDLRLSGLAEGDTLRGQIATDGNLTLRAAVVYPTSGSEFDVQIRNNPDGVLRVEAVGADHPVISALGDLDLVAPRVEQSGRIKAPFGRIGIASGRFTDAGARVADGAPQAVPGGEVVLGAGSLTSLSAEGQVLPYGETRVAGRDWVFNTGGGLAPLLATPEKRLQLDADRVTVADGATIDLSGGGDLKAWEFIAGRGGSADVLAQPGTYAILPALGTGGAPYSADVAAAAGVPAGRVIRLLAPVGDLPAGVYTLLPARYALMEGAYAIRVTSGVSDLSAGTAIRHADGTTVVGAQLGDALQAGAYSFDSRSIGVEVWNGAQVRLRSEYLETLASKHFREGGSSADAGRLTVAAGQSFVLEGIVRANAAAGGRGALVDLTADKLAVVNDAARAQPGEVVLTPELLARLNAESVLLGATRERVIDAGGESKDVVWLVKTDAASRGAASVRVDTAGGADLVAPELILAARESLRLEDGSGVVAAGGTTPGEQVYRIEGSGAQADGALLRVSAGDGATVERSTPARAAGQGGLEIGRNARVAGRSLNLDATGNVELGGRDGGLSQFDLTAPGGAVELAASTVAAGTVPAGVDGLTLGAAELAAVAVADRLTLRSYTTLDLYGSAALGAASLRELVVDAAGIISRDNAGSTQSIAAGRVTLKNAGGALAGAAPADAAGSLLRVSADEIVLGPSAEGAAFVLAGSQRVELAARGQVVGEGSSQTLASGDLDVIASRVTAETGARHGIGAAGDLRVLASGAAAPATPAGIGASLTLEGEQVTIAGRVEAHAGRIDVTARSGDVVIDGTADAPARVSAAGTLLAMGSETYAVDAGTVKLKSGAGDVVVGAQGEVDVSAPGGADAGTLAIEASGGSARVAGSLKGSAEDGGDAGRFTMDVRTIAEAGGALSNLAVRTAEFGRERTIRVRAGDMLLAAADRIAARSINLLADDGSITLQGVLDASGDKGGDIRVYANAGERAGSGVLTVDGASLLARGTGPGGEGQGTASEGGSIDLGVSASAGSSEAPRLAIRSGRFDAGSDHARAGVVTLSAPQGADGVSLAIDRMDASAVSFDAREVALEGYVRTSASQVTSGDTNNSGTTINLGGVYDLALAAVAAVSGLSATNRPVAHETVAMFGRDLLGAVAGDDFGALARADAGSYLGMFAGDLVRDAAGNDDLYPAAMAAIDAAFRGVTAADTNQNQRESVAAVIGAGLLALGTPQAVVDLVQANVADTLQSGLDAAAVLANAGGVLAANGYQAGSAAQSFLGTADARTLVDMSFYAAKASAAAAAAATPTLALQAAIRTYADDRALTTAQATTLATQVANLGNISTGRYRAFAAARRFIGHADKILADTGLADVPNVTVNHDLQVVSSGDITVAADVDFGDVAVTNASTAFQNTASLATGALPVWHAGGNAGRLTLKADGDVKINNNLMTGMTRAFRSTTNAQTQGYVAVMSEPAPAGTPSWGIRVVAGADREAADPLAVKPFETGQKGSVEVANSKVLRGGEAGIEIAARNDVVLKGNGSAIYTVGVADVGSMAFINSTADTRSRDAFARDGGDITIRAGGSVRSDSSSAPPAVTSWLTRIGGLNDGRIGGLPPNQTNPAWFAKLTDFKQGIGTLGGGDLTVVAGDDVRNLALVTVTNGRVEGAAGDVPDAQDLKVRGGGSLAVSAGDEISGVTVYAALGDAELRSDGKQSVELALGDARAKVVAGGDLTVSRIFNPTLEGSGTGIYFSTYGDRSAVDAASLLGDVKIGDFSAGPVALAVAAAAGAVEMGQGMLLPNAANALSVLAGKDVVFKGTVTLGNSDPAMLPSPWRPGTNSNQVDFDLAGISPSLLAARGTGKVVVASAGGDVIGPDHISGGVTPALRSALPVKVSAAGDVVDFGMEIGHVANDQVSSVSAGGDVRFNTKVDAGTGELQNNSVVGFLIDGPGRLQIDAGDDVDLANSFGIVARGNARNGYLPQQAAAIEVLAGTNGADYAALLEAARPGSELGTDLYDQTIIEILTKSSGQPVNLSRILADEANSTLAERRTDSRADLQLWFERYDAALLAAMRTRSGDAAMDLDTARAAFAALPGDAQNVFYQTQRPVLNEILFAGVRYAGRLGDALGQGADGYAPGYTILGKTFGSSSGSGDKGNIEVFMSQIKTEQDVENVYSLATAHLAPDQQEHASAIALLAPLGAINVGVPGGEAGDPTRTGLVAIGKGNVNLIAEDSIEVGPSRIFTLDGGAIQGWSSESDIDGGSSPKTAAATPPPTLRPVGDGFVLDVSGSVSGGGIATLKKDPSVRNAPVRLFAPRGAVDAGDAGIRVSGDLEIGAQQIIGADNISVGGTLSSSAAPPPPAAPATVPAAASTSQSETTAALPGQGLGERDGQREASSLLSVEVVALGDGEAAGSGGKDSDRCDKGKPDGGC